MDEFGDRDGWIWTWTLGVVLFIFTCRLLTARFRFLFRGASFSLPVKAQKNKAQKNSLSDGVVHRLGVPASISDSDFKNLIDNLDENSPDNTVWENVIDKSSNSFSYKAKCCKPKDEPMKYVSVTTFEDCSIEALVNFYMDNHYRTMWDKTVVHHEQLQLDQVNGTEIGRTIKKFPFLTPREYVLSWRLWEGKDGSYYCFSKECEHPLAPKQKKYVRVAVFRSGWRIRKVPGRNACEIRMVHQEDAGLNVEMAKVAFSRGIWSYVCKMDNALRRYSAGKQMQLSASVTLLVKKVPPELEVRNDTVITENLITRDVPLVESCKSNKLKLRRSPSKKLIKNGLLLLGGAICLSRGHSSLGAKVAMAYMLSKITKRNQPGEIQ